MTYGEGNVLNFYKRLAADGTIFITVQVDTDGKEFVCLKIIPTSPKPISVRLKDGRNAILYN
jgi:hypothetical protein